jgi:PAS domain S-box-containing protein
MMRARILIVEDEPATAAHIEARLRLLGYEVPALATSGEEALQQVPDIRPDLLLMDIQLADELDGIETARQIQSQFDIPIIYLSAYDDDETLQRARITEPFGYLLKPFSERELHNTIEIALYKHQIEKQLRQSETKFRTFIENQGEGTGIVDPNETFTFANPAAEQIFGVPAGGLIGRNLREFIVPEQFAFIREQTTQRQHGQTSVYELQIVRPNGDRRDLLVTATPWFDSMQRFIGTFGIFRNITERKQAEQDRLQLEAQLRQAQKLEAIGILVGGIAHDFNNILGTMMGYTELLLAAQSADTKEKTYLEYIYQAGERATDLIQRLLTFSRTQKQLRLIPTSPGPVLEEALHMIRAMLPSSIGIQDAIDRGCHPMLADATQIQQVLVNLSVNALHSMAAHGGILKITLEDVPPDLSQQPLSVEWPEGYLKLTVSDTGCGMTPEVQEHIFDPY